MADARPSSEDLSRWTRDANDFLSSTGRKMWPKGKADELFALGAKRCSTCETVKSLDDFGKSSQARDGMTPRCLGCNRDRSKKWYSDRGRDIREDNWGHIQEVRRKNEAENAEHYREMKREYRKARRAADPFYDSIYSARKRARRFGVPLDMHTSEDLQSYWEDQGIDPGRCYYTGVELTCSNRSIDHKVPLSDPDGPGDVLSNVVPCDLYVNTGRKINMTDEEFSRVIKEEVA